MVKFIKTGKVVIILAGRYAGKKAIVVKSYDEGTKEHAFPHALVAGIERAPLAVTKSMTKKKVLNRTKVKPFVKFINYQHLMPTRYTVNDIDVKSLVLASSLKQADKKKETKKDLKKAFESKYLTNEKPTPGTVYFFKRLRF